MQSKILSKIFNNYISSIIMFSLVYFTGCCTLSSRDKITGLTDEISQLNIQYRELQQNYADLYTKVNTDYAAFDALIQDLQNKVSLLNKSSDLMNESNDEFTSASSTYGRAYGDYLAKKYELAYSGFELFISKYPNDIRVAEARLYMNECLKIFAKRNHDST